MAWDNHMLKYKLLVIPAAVATSCPACCLSIRTFRHFQSNNWLCLIYSSHRPVLFLRKQLIPNLVIRLVVNYNCQDGSLFITAFQDKILCFNNQVSLKKYSKI